MSINPGGHFIDAPDCPACGEPVEEPSTEAFEETGLMVCVDCAPDFLQEPDQ